MQPIYQSFLLESLNKKTFIKIQVIELSIPMRMQSVKKNDLV